MNLVKIDGVGLKSLQAGIERLTDILSPRSFFTFAHLDPKFCRDDRLAPPPFERAAEKLFTLAAAVNVRCIKKVDTRIECGADNCRGSRRVGSPAEVVASDANQRHVKRSKLPIFHGE